MATKTAKKKVKRTGKKPAAKATKKKAAKKTTAKAKKAKTKAKPKVEKPTESKIEEKTEAKLKFTVREGHKEGDPITESDVVKSDVVKTQPPQLRVLEGNPIKDGKRVAYTAVIEDGKYKLGIAAQGEAGYYRIDDTSDAGAPFATYDEAKACADTYNEGLGLNKLEASQIVLSSIGEQNKEERERASLGETDEVDDDGETDESDSDLNDDLHSDGDGDGDGDGESGED